MYLYANQSGRDPGFLDRSSFPSKPVNHNPVSYVAWVNDFIFLEVIELSLNIHNNMICAR